MRARYIRTGVVAVTALTLALLASTARANEWVMVCDVWGDQVVTVPAPINGIGAGASCPGDDSSYGNGFPPGGMAIWSTSSFATQGQSVHWQVNAPQGMTIASVYIPHMYSEGIDDGFGYGGGFYWPGGSGGVGTTDGEPSWSSGSGGSPAFTWPAGGSSYFGWQVVCGIPTCDEGGSEWLSVEFLELQMEETTPPTLSSPDGLWQSNGWVRGDWNVHFWGDSPSGMCSLSAELNDHLITTSTSSVNAAVWHQCAAPAIDDTIDTSQYGQGPLEFVMAGDDAASEPALYPRVVDVDNAPVGLTLAGPTDVVSTSGTQYVTATATAGPSGVAGIACSLDGAPYVWKAVTTRLIAVQGVGVHHVSCYAENNARDQAGNAGNSGVQTWTLSIREPSEASADFSRIVDALRCKKQRERVRIPPRWVTAVHAGHPIRVRLPGETRTVSVVHCHPQTARRRVLVDGHWKIERVVLPPHTAEVSVRSVKYGQAATVSGWLGTAQGNALADQPVRIVTAPDNGSDEFTQAAVVTTAADGSWTASLPAGPSRIVEAQYDGAATVEPTTSAPVRLVVGASLSLRVHPRHTHWGSTIVLSGQLNGGYVPPSGELVVLWIGWRGGSTEIGHLYTKPDGTFRGTYTFLRGNGTETYKLWAKTARESDYPYSPHKSQAVSVSVTP